MQDVVQAIKSSDYLVAFTGAGMDTESNLPDFRGPTGLWKNHDPRTLASTQALETDYSLFREFYSSRIKNLSNVQPHPGHHILAQWEKDGMIKSIITQNVSGLHAAAGSKRVIELHGNIRKMYCHDCGRPATEGAFLAGQSCSCGGRLRPGVTLFGEALPEVAFQQSDIELARADMILILGTSLEVYPAAGMPFMYPMTRVYVDLEATPDRRIDYVFTEKIGSFLDRIDRLLNRLD